MASETASTSVNEDPKDKNSNRDQGVPQKSSSVETIDSGIECGLKNSLLDESNCFSTTYYCHGCSLENVLIAPDLDNELRAPKNWIKCRGTHF
uniref:Uncharacterized protein n=1 Tax=Strigamia maritima TaxID=126957 RepID=T1II17_STRMM